MIENIDNFEILFKEIDSKTKKDVDIYIIGGAALMYLGLKKATKDIDIVTINENDYFNLDKLLKEINFQANKLSAEYRKLSLSEILIRDDYRIDLFNKKVCDKIELSLEMTKRSKIIFNGKRIRCYICSKEDIFVFKCMTEREGDLEDCSNIIKSGIDWKIVEKSILEQINVCRKPVWITYINERIEILTERGFSIPILKMTQRMTEEFYDELEKNVNSQ